MIARAVRGVCVVVWLLAAAAPAVAADFFGQVTFNGQPVPGATVTVTRQAGTSGVAGDKKVASSDPQGIYRFTDLAEGLWTVQVEMFGFAPATREVRIPPDGPPPVVELALLPLAEMTRGLSPPVPVAPAAASAPAAQKPGTPPARGSGQAGSVAARGRGAGPGGGGGFQRAAANPNATPAAAAIPAAASAFRDDDNDARNDGGMGAADGLLINGSVNNGAASPFAQARAFGNNRPGGRGLYNGGFALLTSNSAFDSRQYSFTSQPAPKPDYNDVHFVANFGGPIKIPHLMRRGPNFFGGYQRIQDHSATSEAGLLPTLLERSGDFSQSRNAFGQPVQVVDPVTGRPFPGNVIPADRITPQAASLLGYYPRPNAVGIGANYQTPIIVKTRQDSGQTRLTHQFRNGREQFQGAFQYQRTTIDSANLFSFVDTTQTTGLNVDINYSHRLNQFMFLRSRYQGGRQTNDVTPYFSNVTNVSGNAGILGNDQNPANWGPPALNFSTGIVGL
ncbi:MAG TPA: carboxypeptidase-like regulatory domain-containing protein, partial [Vicinamibacterales bacterium]|nr:carboxypeptidase-like regulatory domain-containing protein [Vicinamibacterales bacterium]